MSSRLEDVADGLARVTSRRRLLGICGKVAALVTGSALGFKSFGRQAYASSYCCNLLYGLCSTCPGCPAGETNAWAWTCCYYNCSYTCQECYDSNCSCAWTDGFQCGPDQCIPGFAEP